jgi:hypothetical protein
MGMKEKKRYYTGRHTSYLAAVIAWFGLRTISTQHLAMYCTFWYQSNQPLEPKSSEQIPNAVAMHKNKFLLPHARKVLENLRHMRVGLLATATRGALLLRLGAAAVDLAWRTRSVQANVHQRSAQVVRVGRDGNLVPLVQELRVHDVLQRRVVVPDRLRDAILCALHQHLLLVLHGLDVVGNRGPAVLEVLDRQALRRLLVLQVALELRRVADVELRLVAVRVVGGVPRDAVAGAVGAVQGAQLLALGVAGPHAQEVHDLIKGHPFRMLAQVVDRVGETRVHVLARALVGGLRVDDGRGSLGRALALCAVRGCVRGRGRGGIYARGRVGLEEGHGGREVCAGRES